MARVRYIYFKRTWKEKKNQALVIPNGYFSPWTVYSFFWGMDPSFNYQKWQRPKLRACRQHFFLSSSWFINQEKDKKQSMRETWVQSYFSPLHCLSSSLILKRVESGVVYLPLSKISKLQFMTLTFLDNLLRNKASLGKISKLAVQTFTISDNSLTLGV